jgi:hypothetical protein
MDVQFCIAIVASGGGYQISAGLAGATYRIHLAQETPITVFVPVGEELQVELQAYAAEYKLGVARFRPSASAETSPGRLKCCAFVEMLSKQDVMSPLLIVDADTYCLRDFSFENETIIKIKSGFVGFVRDTCDRHPENSEVPWFLPKDRRLTYVNSGVILTARSASDIFDRFSEIADEDRFRQTPFHDQTVINFVIGAEFPKRVLFLNPIYNAIDPANSTAATLAIGHLAGGLGDFRDTNHHRFRAFRAMCMRILQGEPADQNLTSQGQGSGRPPA